MELYDTSVAREGDHVVHRTKVRFVHDKMPRGEVTYRVHRRWERWVDPSPAVLVPIALILAAKLGDDLTVEGPLDPEVAAAAAAAIELQCRWWGWRVPALHAPEGRPPRRRGRARGLFFTRGIDSWGALLGERTGPRRRRPTHLIALDCDEHLDEDLRTHLLDGTRAAAAGEGLPLVEVRTDVRRLMDPHLQWGFEAHGAALVGTAYLLGRGLRRIGIASTNWWPDATPWGSHPALDALWSTSRLEVEHLDADEPRWARIGRVAAHQPALDSLQVCFETRDRGNCGRCTKCLLTMASLDLCGALDRCDRFDVPLDTATIDAIPQTNVNPVIGMLDHCDAIGLAADAMRQHWEQVPLIRQPGFVYRTVSYPARVVVLGASGDRLEGAALDAAARALAPLGVRVDRLGRTDLPVVVVGADLEPATLTAALRLAEVTPSPEDAWDPDGRAPDGTEWGRRRRLDARHAR